MVAGSCEVYWERIPDVPAPGPLSCPRRTRGQSPRGASSRGPPQMRRSSDGGRRGAPCPVYNIYVGKFRPRARHPGALARGSPSLLCCLVVALSSLAGRGPTPGRSVVRGHLSVCRCECGRQGPSPPPRTLESDACRETPVPSLSFRRGPFPRTRSRAWRASPPPRATTPQSGRSLRRPGTRSPSPSWRRPSPTSARLPR